MALAVAAVAPTDFRGLATQVREAGLLDRRVGSYGVRIALTLAAYGAGWWAFVVIGPSWATLAIALWLGIVWTQLGFLGHDAGHGQIFRSRRANRRVGLLVGNALIGLSFGWWVPKHSAHHAHPNEVDRDPDIGLGMVVGSLEERGLLARGLARWQAELFFPLMLLRSTGLYVSGVQDLCRRRDRTALLEGTLLAVHAVGFLFVVFWVLPPLEAVGFLAVHQAVFSLYLGCSFAPNHKGMPLIDGESEMSFARRQVVTARNIAGGRCTSFVFGGLNYQIEHHLFPAMPRPNLRRARALVRPFCIENGFGYCEETALGSYRQAVRHMRLTARADAELAAAVARASA